MTMRAMELAIFIIILQAGIVFVNDIGVFDSDYITTPNNTYTQWRVDNLSDTMEDPEDYSLLDWFWISVQWVLQGLFVIIKVLLAVVIVLPFLVIEFHVPLALASFLQVGIYVIYWLGYVSWKSGRTLEGHI